HAGEAEEMVGVEVREEDLLEVREPDHRPLQLPLRAFRAVEEEALAAAPYEQPRGCAMRCRHRRRGAEEDEVEVHRLAIVGSRAWRIRACSRSTGARSRQSSTGRSASCTRRTRLPRMPATSPP